MLVPNAPLQVKDIENINHFVQKTFKTTATPQYGFRSLKDQEMLEALLSRTFNSIIFNEDQYPTPFDKAFHLFQGIATHQWFRNGNKRTAYAVMFCYLGMQGYYLDQRIFTNLKNTESLISFDDIIITHYIDNILFWFDQLIIQKENTDNNTYQNFYTIYTYHRKHQLTTENMTQELQHHIHHQVLKALVLK